MLLPALAAALVEEACGLASGSDLLGTAWDADGGGADEHRAQFRRELRERLFAKLEEHGVEEHHLKGFEGLSPDVAALCAGLLGYLRRFPNTTFSAEQITRELRRLAPGFDAAPAPAGGG